MNINITDTKIKFNVCLWRHVYVIKSQFGHYLWSDGTVHDDAGLSKDYNNSTWCDRSSAEDYLETWIQLHDFNRIDVLTVR